jgi:two-component system, NtrC family, nitrogen regulation sensor histidine kinase NtrY
VSLRARITAYLAVLHLLFATVSALLLAEHRYWVFAVEAVFLLSFLVGLRLARAATRGLGLAGEGARMIEEEEFTSRFRRVGERDVDSLVGVYNRMVDHLRDERTRVQEQHHFLAQVLQVSPSGILILDFDGHVSEMNPAAERILAVARDAALGKGLAEVRGPLAAAMQSLEHHTSEVVGLSGATRVKLHHGTFIDRGFPRSFFLIEELTEELRQFERAAYEKLIRVMSHEVNNTVAAANSLLHSSLDYGRDGGRLERTDFEQAIGIVIGRTEQLSAFMRRFADVFRLPRPQLAPSNLAEVVRPVVALARAMPEASGVTWGCEIEAAAIAEIDRSLFEQALLNILKNAAEAAGPRGTVTVRLSVVDDRPAIEVSDDGPGPTAEAEANLFTPFFSTKPNGQGIGLTLVQEVLSAHGCSYSLERLGARTVFRIGWP